MIFRALILICATSTAGPDCQPNTAIDVIRPAGNLTMQQCFFQGQSILAAGALKPSPGTWAKVMCRPVTGLETVESTQ